MNNIIKVALVTGAGSDIGLALVDQLISPEGIETGYACCRKPVNSVGLLERAKNNLNLLPLKMDITSEVVHSLPGMVRSSRSNGLSALL